MKDSPVAPGKDLNFIQVVHALTETGPAAGGEAPI
jgi:hypothetical protein